MLRLTTFGGVGIRTDGPGEAPAAELSLSRRALALLVLVAAAPETGISRDKVVALLWPESSEERGRNALRQALHTLRRELQAPDLLLGIDALRLNPDAITSDLRDFEAARASGRMEEAVGRYGGPFLDGFHVGGAPEFERWVEETRSSYGRDFAAMLEGLAREAGRAGNFALAVKWWRKLAAVDPLNSAVALGLMEALAKAGDRAGALRHGQVHEILIREEVGAGPDPAITGLMERLRACGPSVSAAVPAGDSIPRQGQPSEAVTPGQTAPARDFISQLREELEGRYLIEGETERGREGAVRLLRARDIRHDRQVVLKVLHPVLASMLDVYRFLREIKLTARLVHPHIVPLLDSGEVNGRPWYALPEVGGTSLRLRLADQVPIPRAEALRIVEEVAGALDYAHRHGVLHRHVCPEDIVLAEGHALLTNLGLGRALDAAAGPKVTETGMLVGSPAYMSPEQADGKAALDGRSDQYSLACVLFEMLEGEPLFSGPTPQAIMAKRSAPHDHVGDRLAHLPAEVSRSLRRALAPKPDRRFPTAGEFARDLTTGGSSPAAKERRWPSWLRLG